MTSLLDHRPGAGRRRRGHRRRTDPGPGWPRRRGRTRVPILLAGLLVVAVAGGAVAVAHVRNADLRRDYLGANDWPVTGQAAYRENGVLRTSPDQTPVPIASLAKVMTAYLVLRAMPLHGRESGPRLRVSAADVGDYEARRAHGESVVAVRAGTRLTERQALVAVLLPSANNVAVLLARWVAGSVPEFVARMNATARRLGMADTRYSDPSGYDPGTVSTARDQTLLAAAAAGDDTFANLVSITSYRMPVAGTVRNTDALLGHDGFVGTKTGSDGAAGGCFMFRTYRVVGGNVVDVVGVVLGQRGRHAITAGLQAARQLADRIGPAAGA